MSHPRIYAPGRLLHAILWPAYQHLYLHYEQMQFVGDEIYAAAKPSAQKDHLQFQYRKCPIISSTLLDGARIDI